MHPCVANSNTRVKKDYKRAPVVRWSELAPGAVLLTDGDFTKWASGDAPKNTRDSIRSMLCVVRTRAFEI